MISVKRCSPEIFTLLFLIETTKDVPPQVHCTVYSSVMAISNLASQVGDMLGAWFSDSIKLQEKIFQP